MNSTAHNTLPTATKSVTRPAISPFAQLLRKELRLQRGNFLFACAATLLGMIMLPFIASNSQNLGGFPPADIQNSLMMAALLPVLILILPAMIGSTAAAAEKSLGVLPWQDALPVPRWKIILVKTIIIIAACAVVAGVLPYILRPLLMDSDTVPGLFRGFWTGLHGIVFGAIGFYAGSFAKDDYQGLLLAIIPAAAVVAALVLPDYFGKVLPVLAPYPLTRPWAIVIRLLAVAALLILLASKMHLRIPTRRWRPMLVSLVAVFVGGVTLTIWNLQVEGSVLASPKANAREELADWVNHVQAIYPKKQIAKTEPIAGVKQQFKLLEPMSFISLASGKRIVVASVDAKYVNGRAGGTAVVIKSDASVVEFPQAFFPSALLAGISRNQEWLLIENPGQKMPILCGPYCLTIPLHLLPNAIANRIFELADIDYNAQTWGGWDVSWEKLQAKKSPDDIAINTMFQAGILWKNGINQIPPKAKARLLFSAEDSWVLAEVETTDKTTMSAVLRRTQVRAEYELTGYVNGWPSSISHDGQWVRGSSEHGSTYRHVADWDDAAAQPVLTSTFGSTRYDYNTKVKLPNGSTFNSHPIPFTIPVIQTTSGPATIQFYSIQQDATSGTKASRWAYEFGLNVIDLHNGTTTTIPLTYRTTAPEQDVGLSWKAVTASWDQESQTLAYYDVSTVHVLQLRKAKALTREALKATEIIAPRNSANVAPFLDSRKYLQCDTDTIYLSTW